MESICGNHDLLRVEDGCDNKSLSLSSRRASVSPRRQSVQFEGKQDGSYIARFNFCGCGHWMRLKIVKEEEGFRICGISLAAHCHLILLIFGLCFLLAGIVLTVLSYRKERNEEHEFRNNGLFSALNHKPSSSKEEGKVAGPIFLFVGFILELLGVIVAFIGYKLNREMKRQKKLHQLGLQSFQTPDLQEYSFSKLDDLRSRNGSREISATSGEITSQSIVAMQGYALDRRRTLPTIAHAVPVGFFLFGGESSALSRTTSTPSDVKKNNKNEFPPQYTSNNPDAVQSLSDRQLNVQPVEFKENSHKNTRSDDGKLSQWTTMQGQINDSNSRRSSNSSYNRTSLPLPMFMAPSFISSSGPRLLAPMDPVTLIPATKSDEPFGSIASLSGTGEIASFPASQLVQIKKDLNSGATCGAPEQETKAAAKARGVKADYKGNSLSPGGNANTFDMPPIHVYEPYADMEMQQHEN